jgi:hypothetical protein
MNSRQAEALEAVIRHLEAAGVEVAAHPLGWPLKILRDYLALEEGKRRVKTFLLVNGSHPAQPKFPLGRVAVTAGANELVSRAGGSLTALLHRHAACDWGECGAEERNREYWGVWPLFSSYVFAGGRKVWVITEGDRRGTMILLPDEFDVLYASGQVSLLPDFGIDRMI